MHRSTRQRLVLLLAVLALLLVAGRQWHDDRQQAPGTLLSLDPDRIERISVQFGNAPAEHYRKRDGHWWCTDGNPYRADDGRLQDLADTAAANVLSWRPRTDFKLGLIGLQPPSAVLRLNGHVLSFGESSVTGPQRYVLVGQRVALVSARYSPRPARNQTITAP